MAELKQGTVTIAYPDHIPMPDRAGKLTPDEVARLEKGRRGIGLAAAKTAEAMAKYPDKLTVPGVTAAELAAAGTAAEDIDTVISDLEALLVRVKQANNLIDADANKMLRRVLTHVRGQEKFDARIADLVPVLLAYFANARSEPSEPAPTT